MAQCLCETVSALWVSLYGYVHGYGRADSLHQQEAMFDQFNTRLVQLEQQDKRCLSEARRHRAAGSSALFRSKMLERRRIHGQIAQVQRFKENAMAQLDALSNHELNRTFVRAMRGMVGASKGRVAVTREDAAAVMEDLQDSLLEVKDLSEFLGQPAVSEDVDDAELEREFLEEEEGSAEPPSIRSVAAVEEVVKERPQQPLADVAEARATARIEDMLVLPSF